MRALTISAYMILSSNFSTSPIAEVIITYTENKIPVISAKYPSVTKYLNFFYYKKHCMIKFYNSQA